MEREVPVDIDALDLEPELGADAVPPVEPPEPPRDGGGGGGPIPGPPDPETGPWFSLSMVAYIAFTGLMTGAVMVGSSGGEPVAYAFTFGLLVVYVGFFAVGAFWFRGYRTR